MIIKWLFVLLLLLIVLYNINSNDINDDNIEILWKQVLTVNSSCPRFIYCDTSHQGLADQLERLFLSLSLSYKYQSSLITLVVPDSFALVSLHRKTGYADVFKSVLGIPVNALHRLSTVKKTYHLKDVDIMNFKGSYGEYLNGIKDLSILVACNSLVIIDVYDTCKGWCPFFYANEVQDIIKPFLRSTLMHSSNCSSSSSSLSSSLALPLSNDKINIVWHVRSFGIAGDVCAHCNDSNYYTNIYQSILPAFTSSNSSSSSGGYLSHQNIVVHMKSFAPKIPLLFQNIPNLNLYDSDDMNSVICTFIKADILIATGSSLPPIITYFTPRLQPILLQDIRTFAIAEKAKYTHVVNEHDSIQLRNGYFHYNDNSINSSIVSIINNNLRDNKVLDRVSSSSSSKL